jgi:hypothetical protein
MTQEGIPPTLGAIAADYMPDIQYALTGESDAWRPEPHTVFATRHMGLMLHDLGMDPDAYITITTANEARTHIAIEAAVNEPVDEDRYRRENVAHAVTGGGQMAAIMIDARNTATVEGHVAADEDFNATLGQVDTWTGVALSIAEAPLSERFPVAGTAVSELRGVIAESVFSSLERNSETAANTQADRVTSAVRGNYRETIIPESVQDALTRGGIRAHRSRHKLRHLRRSHLIRRRLREWPLENPRRVIHPERTIRTTVAPRSGHWST